MRNYRALTSATTQFREQRAKVREEQRQELKDRTHAELVNLGAEITFLTNDGATIQEIEHAMGSKSRTLIYEAKRAYAASNQPAPPEPEPVTPNEEYKLVPNGTMCITVEWADGSEDDLDLEENGTITYPPQHWLGLDKTREQRRLYARIIAEAEALANA
jgi:hypothetical protein